MQLCGSWNILWHCLSLGLELKLTFSISHCWVLSATNPTSVISHQKTQIFSTHFKTIAHIFHFFKTLIIIFQYNLFPRIILCILFYALKTFLWEEFIGLSRFVKGSKARNNVMKLCHIYEVFCWSKIFLPLTSFHCSHISPLKPYASMWQSINYLKTVSYHVSINFSSQTNHLTILHLSLKRYATGSPHHSDQLPQHPS